MKEINQKSIYEKADVPQSTFSNILNGRRRLSWRIAKKLATITNTEPGLLMEISTDELKEIIKEAHASHDMASDSLSTHINQ